MRCPRCETKLERLTTKNTPFDGCEKCGGVWLARAVWDQVQSARSSKVVDRSNEVSARSRKTVKPDAAPIACPSCHQPMHVTRVAMTDVEVDVCTEHGVWFDRDELGQAVRGPRPSAGLAVGAAAVGAAALADSPPPAAKRVAVSGNHDGALEFGSNVLEATVDVADSGLAEGLGSLLEGAGELVGGLLEVL